jgi:hypothetical protein
MAALRTSEPYFSQRRIPRKTRGHGPAAAVGAFHQQSVRLDRRSGSQILSPMDQKTTSSDANSSRKIKFLILPEKSGGWIEETTLPLIKLRRDLRDAADLVGPAGARFSP